MISAGWSARCSSLGAQHRAKRGVRVRHLYIGSRALGISADEFFTSSTVSYGENGRNKVKHFQSMRLVLIEKVHAVSNFNYVGAMRVGIVLQDKLGYRKCVTKNTIGQTKKDEIKKIGEPAREERRSSCGQPLGALAIAPSMFAPRRRDDSPRTARALSGNQQRNSFVQ
jgi:hypothetical protein